MHGALYQLAAVLTGSIPWPGLSQVTLSSVASTATLVTKPHKFPIPTLQSWLDPSTAVNICDFTKN